MRTDSVNLSNMAMGAAKNTIVEEYGEKYHKSRRYKTKIKGAQEAHEAIRPTYIKNKNVSGTSDQTRLYELIRNRTVASQMSDAILEKTTVKIDISTRKENFQAQGEIIVFDGFLKVYKVSTDDENGNGSSTLLPPLVKGEETELNRTEAVLKFSKHPPRYTEASLVRKMEELGIGRPSTYAPTISTIQKRGYIIKENRPGKTRKYDFITLKNDAIKEQVKSENYGAEKSKFFPTDIGMVVNDFLVENFENIVDYNFTADVEQQFDKIAAGKKVWHKMIDEFYKPFHKTIEKTVETAERNTGERILGTDPETNREVLVRIGRFGPIAQLGTAEDDKKPQYVSLPKDKHLETITLEEVLDLLKNAGNGRLLGKDPNTGKNIYARLGRFGAMVQLGEADDKEKPTYASLQAGMTLEGVTLAQAVELFKLPRTIGEYEKKTVVAAVGRFGPYIRHDSKFVSLKKTDDPLSVSLERAIELIEEKREKDKAKMIKEFTEESSIKIIKDRWNRPCIYYNKKYTNISKIENPEELTLEQCKEMVGFTEAKPKTKKKSTAKRKTVAKKK